jgi:hypothetical protein
VQMLKPGTKNTHRAYLWAYAPGAFEDLKAVVYDFCESRAGHCDQRAGGLAPLGVRPCWAHQKEKQCLHCFSRCLLRINS